MESVHGTVAGLDVHKKTVVAVVLDSDHSEEDHASAVFGTTRHGLNELIAFLRQHEVTHAATQCVSELLLARVQPSVSQLRQLNRVIEAAHQRVQHTAATLAQNVCDDRGELYLRLLEQYLNLISHPDD